LVHDLSQVPFADGKFGNFFRLNGGSLGI